MTDGNPTSLLRTWVERHASELLGESTSLVDTDAEFGVAGLRADYIAEDDAGRRHPVFVSRVVTRSYSGKLASISRQLREHDRAARVRVVSLDVPAERRHFLSRVGVECHEVPFSRLRELKTPAEPDPAADAPRGRHLIARREIGPGAYPVEELDGLSRSFEQATHKVWDLRTGENSWKTDGTALIDFLFDCGREVSDLCERGILLSHEVRDLAVAGWLAGLDEAELEKLRSNDDRALDLSSELAGLLMAVTHRVRANKGSKDPKCTRHLDRPLEAVIGDALAGLREEVAFLPRLKPGGAATEEDCLRLLERIDVPRGQRQLYGALLAAGDSGMGTSDLIATMGRRDQYDLAGVLGALGNRINNTPGFGKDAKPGILMVLEVEEAEGGQWWYRLREVMASALRNLDPDWLRDAPDV